MFRRKQKLKLLHMFHNNISRIAAKVISSTFIEFLILERNSINFIVENAFANMTKLSFFGRKSNNFMGTAVSRWKTFNLKNNKLKNLTENNIAIFRIIYVIFFNSNKLKWIHDGTFNCLSQLQVLNLSCNNLQSLLEKNLPYNGLPSLNSLLLYKNRINYFPKSFVRYIPKLKNICILHNPWKCACYIDKIYSLTIIM